MKKILTASTNGVVINTVNTACRRFSAYFSTEVFDSTEAVIGYINYEVPEIKVLDYTSPDIDCQKILEAIRSDSWLHYGGVIAVCESSRQVEQLEELKDTNMIAILTVSNFKVNFARILRILWQNQQFLFERGMQDSIGGQESGSFLCGNDPMDIRFYTNFLVSYLYNTNRISGDDRYKLQMTLMEFLTNALEHGNLGITYEDKTKWLMAGKDMMEFFRERAADPKYADKKIHISYTIGKGKSKFTIRDEGDGFDWRKYIDKEASFELHGRGIALSREFAKNISYNEKGNEVSFEIANIMNAVNTIPGIMEAFSTIEYKDKEIVFRENEVSNDLFFIVSGRFAVYTSKKLTSVLTPKDMFIGEMAFLLNDRRTATVLAVGNCRVKKIPKAAFLSSIRKNPHYGIFLSKILARRLQKQTIINVELQKKLSEIENRE